MKFLCDVTIREGELVMPNIFLTKRWKVKNYGNLRWPPGCNIRLISGANLSQKDVIIVDSLNPDEENDICVEILSPK